MLILDIKELAIPDIKVIRFKKFSDERGYFAETLRMSDINSDNRLNFMNNAKFNQYNQGFSQANTFRGFHFQWNPYMDKLVRCISGTLYDMALDIRINSPYFGKVCIYKIEDTAEFGEWMWLPKGFAHGLYVPEETIIEYFCTGHWNKDCELSINPFDKAIDWSLNTNELNNYIHTMLDSKDLLISDKDRTGVTLNNWLECDSNKYFDYGNIINE
ncbi:MAG TPA: dTDP-4-dehydrorhamnose 3,5-epimerase family protein [Candidatus Kapabacteria bacterium]|nr:dTDP-4-dehydrorhamnose 3,5-epimerase family protein [Candidatus Kapabacteria bacterium]